MSEPKKGSKEGDEVLVKARVAVAGNEHIAVDLPDSAGRRFVAHGNYTLVESDKLQVGDRVSALCSGRLATIRDIRRSLTLEFDDTAHFVQGCDADQLTRIPPEPKYRVIYEDDLVSLMELQADGSERRKHSIQMENTIHIPHVVDRWAKDYGIDADEVYAMIAVPTEIARKKLDTAILCTASRLRDGWHARICYSPGTVRIPHTFGSVLPKVIGEAVFREINGPYLEETP